MAQFVNSPFAIALERLPEAERFEVDWESEAVPIDHYVSQPPGSGQHPAGHWIGLLDGSVPDHFFPLVLWGESGVGKSRLAESLACRLAAELTRRQGSRAATLMLSAKKYRRRYLQALEADAVDEFRHDFVHLDVLVVDGLEQLGDSPQTQVELVYVLEAFQRFGKRMIVTGRDSPSTCGYLSPQLASRISHGLTIPVDRPDRDSRRRIIGDLIEHLGISLTSEAADYLHGQLDGSVPQIYQSLSRIAGLANSGEPLDLPTVRLGVASRLADESPLRLSRIAKSVAAQFDVKVADLRGKTRRHKIVEARGVAMLVARKLLALSYQKIGEYFGNRDHSTVRHAIGQIEAHARRDAAFANTVQFILNKNS